MATPRGTPSKQASGAGTLATMIASLALYRSANKAGTPQHVPNSTDPAKLAEHLTVPRPDGGMKLVRYRFEQYQRTHGWIGFPLGVVKKFVEDKAGLLAALISYFGFFSIFPLMLAFLSIIGFVLDPDEQARFATQAANQIPVVGQTIVDTVQRDGAVDGSTIGAVIGILVAIWSGLKMIDSMQNALNDVWDIPPVERPNVVKRRGRSLLMLAVLGGGIVASVVVSGLATFIDDLPGGGKFGIWFGSAAISVIVYLVAFQLLTDAQLPWRDLVPGAIFGGVSWWALQTFGAGIVSSSAKNETFGSFASIIVLMTFFFIAAQLSIFGAEISVVKSRRLWPRSWTKGDLTPQDVVAYELLAASTQMDKSYDVRLVPSREFLQHIEPPTRGP